MPQSSKYDPDDNFDVLTAIAPLYTRVCKGVRQAFDNGVPKEILASLATSLIRQFELVSETSRFNLAAKKLTGHAEGFRVSSAESEIIDAVVAVTQTMMGVVAEYPDWFEKDASLKSDISDFVHSLAATVPVDSPHTGWFINMTPRQN